MKEIPVNSAEVQEALQKRVNKNGKQVELASSFTCQRLKFKKSIPAYAVIAILIITFILSYDMPMNKPKITITASAAETGETQLSNKFVTFKTDTTLKNASATIDKLGNYSDANINYNIRFLCEGQNIETITYTCSDMDITRDNSSKASAYYVENITMPVDEYLNSDWKNDETFLNGFYGQGEEEAYLTKMIGSSYTVTYDEQLNKQYGLVIAATVDEDENYHFEDLTIHLEIKMADGSIQHKKLLLHPGKDAFSEVEIRILD